VDKLIPRHRRKAGSGPPANALIAWIGADPYLREAAATASYQREITLPLPSRTRSAKAAVVVCFVLSCGAVLGITTIISHGRSADQLKIATPTPPTGSAPDQESSSSFPAQAGSAPVLSPAPVGMAPMLAERATPHPVTVPSANHQTNQNTDDQSSKVRGYTRADPVKPGHTNEPPAAGKPSRNNNHADSDKPTQTPANPGMSDKPVTPGPGDLRTLSHADGSDQSGTNNKLGNPSNRRASGGTTDPIGSDHAGDTNTQGRSDDTATGEPSVPVRTSGSGLKMKPTHGSASGDWSTTGSN
jgi:hypothetical protein